MSPLSPQTIAARYIAACEAELDALKPGNVHRIAGGHRMEVEAFETSARVSAPHITGESRSLGRRVLGAVRATREAVGENTNLGILLLCAPLAMAAERGGDLRAGVAEALAGLTSADAADVFAAIALASPGGLGSAENADVREPPNVGLLDAMRIAAPRDRIARAYTDALADVFAIGLPSLAGSERPDLAPATRCFLAFAARFPDSHIARKYGSERAELIRGRFETLTKQLKANANPETARAALLDLDHALKSEGVNPGTSADFTVASIFAMSLSGGLKIDEADG
ncbi:MULTISPECIES: triphosphoribosyl-dephospho-CoA synthase [unclassified Aureimonas]|uniref:triphosphoribosyl-dephospho-CoA synthase n=1 Tax=unclassified Aureimonas TaxID=2615206 RepID=UPI0006F8672E|nr:MULTISPECIES: triphosphoribosyl-dephospho-CoA synthase [unclassified Aureimonas]KQT69993.1 hypothetical protein ASG62_02555 [Aureimonas sp. Leaf427]KQT75851.1 hypothetical protein ASG54_13660 [Aureimonas sp. Leaf460]